MLLLYVPGGFVKLVVSSPLVWFVGCTLQLGAVKDTTNMQKMKTSPTRLTNLRSAPDTHYTFQHISWKRMDLIQQLHQKPCMAVPSHSCRQSSKHNKEENFCVNWWEIINKYMMFLYWDAGMDNYWRTGVWSVHSWPLVEKLLNIQCDIKNMSKCAISGYFILHSYIRRE